MIRRISGFWERDYATKLAEQMRCDAIHARETGSQHDGAPELRSLPASWIDEDQIAAASKAQEGWNSVMPADREAARRRLAAIEHSTTLIARGWDKTVADDSAGRKLGLSAGTVGKWRRRYGGRSAIVRIVRLLDERLQPHLPIGQ